MRDAARAFLERVPQAQRPFDDSTRRWLEYRPRERPGVSFTTLDPAARKYAHRLLATALQPHAYAQAIAIIALEEVLDREEGWGRGRHSNDYWVVVYGDPAQDDRWTWRLEGHHLSVTMTLDGETVAPSPVFFGANPHAVRHAGRTVLSPLATEEQLARELLAAMGSAARAEAVVADRPPADIYSGQSPDPDPEPGPRGVAASRLNRTAKALLDQLVGLYLARVPDDVAPPIDTDELAFAWEGSTLPGQGHYYRITASDLLVEYDNIQNNANHAHTVLRRPRSDFGGTHDPLRAHHATEHG
jgi:hypothetical protein